MAADNVGVSAAYGTLVADTLFTINLTALQGNKVRIVHGGNVAAPVFFQIAATEAALTSFALLADDVHCITPNEGARTIGVPTLGMWVRFRSSGAVVIGVESVYV